MNYNTLILKTKYFSSADLKPIFPKSKHSRLDQHFIELHQQFSPYLDGIMTDKPSNLSKYVSEFDSPYKKTLL